MTTLFSLTVVTLFLVVYTSSFVESSSSVYSTIVQLPGLRNDQVQPLYESDQYLDGEGAETILSAFRVASPSSSNNGWGSYGPPPPAPPTTKRPAFQLPKLPSLAGLRLPSVTGLRTAAAGGVKSAGSFLDLTEQVVLANLKLGRTVLFDVPESVLRAKYGIIRGGGKLLVGLLAPPVAPPTPDTSGATDEGGNSPIPPGNIDDNDGAVVPPPNVDDTPIPPPNNDDDNTPSVPNVDYGTPSKPQDPPATSYGTPSKPQDPPATSYGTPSKPVMHPPGYDSSYYGPPPTGEVYRFANDPIPTAASAIAPELILDPPNDSKAPPQLPQEPTEAPSSDDSQSPTTVRGPGQTKCFLQAATPTSFRQWNCSYVAKDEIDYRGATGESSNLVNSTSKANATTTTTTTTTTEAPRTTTEITFTTEFPANETESSKVTKVVTSAPLIGLNAPRKPAGNKQQQQVDVPLNFNFPSSIFDFSAQGGSLTTPSPLLSSVLDFSANQEQSPLPRQNFNFPSSIFDFSANNVGDTDNELTPQEDNILPYRVESGLGNPIDQNGNQFETLYYQYVS